MHTTSLTEALDILQAAGEAGRPPGLETCAAIARHAEGPRRPQDEGVPAALDALLVTRFPIVALEAMTHTGLMARLLPEVAALRAMPRDQGRHKDVPPYARRRLPDPARSGDAPGGAAARHR
ncbi:MAG: hypothetical protein U0531_12545 [Dehalococcoidia bacterium]